MKKLTRSTVSPRPTQEDPISAPPSEEPRKPLAQVIDSSQEDMYRELNA